MKIELDFIDNEKHGYLKISKFLFLSLGIDKHKISKYSGISGSYIYLEEDMDGSYVLNEIKAKGIEYYIYTTIDPSYLCPKNYNPYLLKDN